MVIDARGLGCPKPVLMAEEALSGIPEGMVDVVVDNEGSSDNLMRFAKRNGFHAEALREGDYWRVKIVKGYVCEAPGEKPESPAGESAENAGTDILMVVATDSLGREEELGRTLMKGFFETMKATKEIPRTIFFLNAGVKLTTLNEETIPVLREIEAMGAEIFSCGTCLKYYGLEQTLGVGFRGTTSDIIENMAERRKTLWIG
jgi:selenium metabolism protein YedF